MDGPPLRPPCPVNTYGLPGLVRFGVHGPVVLWFLAACTNGHALAVEILRNALLLIIITPQV